MTKTSICCYYIVIKYDKDNETMSDRQLAKKSAANPRENEQKAQHEN